MTYKIIFDTNFYYSAIGFDNLLYRLLVCMIKDDSKFQQYSSPAIIQELTTKLYSSKFDQKTKNQIFQPQKDKFIELITKYCKIVTPTVEIKVCRDPKDDMFLELASTIGADYIITGDKDLLVIGGYQGVKIRKPSEFIEELGIAV